MESREALAEVQQREWFYEFELPDGTRTRSYLPQGVAHIHPTRAAMLLQAVEPLAEDMGWDDLRVIDVACHQGYFASLLARKGCREVIGVDARPEHVRDASLIAAACGLANMRVVRGDVNRLDAKELGTFDITLMLGLLYHIENPVGALRMARSLTRRACVIETQVTPNLTGIVDWGSYRFQRSIIGSLALVDELQVTDDPESSTTGICIVPSYEALLWLLRAVGFSRVERIPPPAGAYEQHASGKRVMVLAHAF
jgi:protein-L-isoaspartate O-methyltransferase